jgi:hypothetical protein
VSNGLRVTEEIKSPGGVLLYRGQRSISCPKTKEKNNQRKNENPVCNRLYRGQSLLPARCEIKD